MSPIIQIILIAGIVVAVFLLAAALVWGIRMRRDEGNFIPAPASLKPYKRTTLEISAGNEDVQEREPNPDLRGSTVAERIPIGAGPQSPFGDFLRNAVPQLSSVMDLAKLVKEMQAAGELADTPDERNAALRTALDRMLEQQPRNEILLQLRDSLPYNAESDTDADDEGEINIEVIQVAGRNVIRVDGTEYYSLADISDPDIRDEARQLLTDLDEEET